MIPACFWVSRVAPPWAQVLTAKRWHEVVQAVDSFDPTVAGTRQVVVVPAVVEQAQHRHVLQGGGATACPGLNVVHLALIRPTRTPLHRTHRRFRLLDPAIKRTRKPRRVRFEPEKPKLLTCDRLQQQHPAEFRRLHLRPLPHCHRGPIRNRQHVVVLLMPGGPHNGGISGKHNHRRLPQTIQRATVTNAVAASSCEARAVSIAVRAVC